MMMVVLSGLIDGDKTNLWLLGKTSILLGIGAVYGGVTLVIDPSGELLGLPLSVIDPTPFDNYLIPGMILLVMIGLLPFFIAYSAVRKLPKYDWMIIAQGILLVIWLTAEIVMGIFDPFFHYTYYTMAAILIILGTILSMGANKKV